MSEADGTDHDDGIRLTMRDMEQRKPYPESLKGGSYERQLRELQIELLKLQSWTKTTGARILILFEGRDAAGKGGSISRFTDNLNPRGSRVVALAKPSEVERSQWYFQRYVAHLPSAGEIVFFDRSWYNRAGVEVVMGFCSAREHAEFFQQAPTFEDSIVQSGIHLFKLWFAVSADEQRKRFRDRHTDPLKKWKISPIDEAALPLYDEYGKARDEMLLHTDRTTAPWTVINSNEKRRARLESMRHVLHELDYDHKDMSVAHAPDPRVVRPASALRFDAEAPAAT